MAAWSYACEFVAKPTTAKAGRSIGAFVLQNIPNGSPRQRNPHLHLCAAWKLTDLRGSFEGNFTKPMKILHNRATRDRAENQIVPSKVHECDSGRRLTTS